MPLDKSNSGRSYYDGSQFIPSKNNPQLVYGAPAKTVAPIPVEETTAASTKNVATIYAPPPTTTLTTTPTTTLGETPTPPTCNIQTIYTAKPTTEMTTGTTTSTHCDTKPSTSTTKPTKTISRKSHAFFETKSVEEPVVVVETTKEFIRDIGEALPPLVHIGSPLPPPIPDVPEGQTFEQVDPEAFERLRNALVDGMNGNRLPAGSRIFKYDEKNPMNANALEFVAVEASDTRTQAEIEAQEKLDMANYINANYKELLQGLPWEKSTSNDISFDQESPVPANMIEQSDKILDQMDKKAKPFYKDRTGEADLLLPSDSSAGELGRDFGDD